MLTSYIDASTPATDRVWDRLYTYKSALGPYSLSNGLYSLAADIVATESIDIIIVDGLWQFCGVVASRIARDYHVRVLQYTHGQLDPYFFSEPIKIARKLIYWILVEYHNLKLRSAIIYTHPYEASYAKMWTLGLKTPRFILPLGIYGCPPSVSNSPERAEPTLALNILFFGRIHPKKGLDLLIKAIALLPDTRQVNLRVVGPVDSLNYRRRLTRLCTNLKLDEVVTWFDPVYGLAKWNIYKESDVFMLPSRGENFGLTIPEALSSGIPVICSDKAALHAYISEYSAGYVCTTSPSSISFAIQQFLSASDVERKAMSNNAVSLFKNVFHVSSVGSNLSKIIATSTS
jgi:glycosyltransferase involved in cell wall biosynthesis